MHAATPFVVSSPAGDMTLTRASTKPASSGPKDRYPASDSGKQWTSLALADGVACTSLSSAIEGVDREIAPAIAAAPPRKPRRPSLLWAISSLIDFSISMQSDDQVSDATSIAMRPLRCAAS